MQCVAAVRRQHKAVTLELSTGQSLSRDIRAFDKTVIKACFTHAAIPDLRLTGVESSQ